MNIFSIGTRYFGEAQNKITRVHTQSGQYHTIVESRVRLTPIITSFDSTLRLSDSQMTLALNARKHTELYTISSSFSHF